MGSKDCQQAKNNQTRPDILRFNSNKRLQKRKSGRTEHRENGIDDPERYPQPKTDPEY
jgi:hypothetical protein